MKTNELSGDVLDVAVVLALGYTINENRCAVLNGTSEFNVDCFNPSEVWAQGGPIIERERIELRCWEFHSTPWKASIGRDSFELEEYGPTPLIAAMRCYVASKLGDEIEIPEELVKE